MVKLKVKRDSEWNQYQVVWLENGKRNEGKTAYIPGLDRESVEDAVSALIYQIKEYRAKGMDISPNEDKFTIDTIARVAPGFLIGETRREIGFGDYQI